MATVSWSQTSVVGSNVVINGSYYTARTPFDILASGETFDVILPSRTLTLVSSVAGNTMYQVSAPKITVTYGSGSTVTRSLGSTYTSPSVAQGTAVALPAVTNNNFRTANLFNSNNPTVAYVDCPMIIDYAGVYFSATANYFSYPNVTIGTARVKLNAPPTYDATDLTFDKSYIYAGLTTASVTVSNTTAYYGGTVESATLTIGNQTATITGDGTLSILLNAGGTFTPTITVTDSRGQTTTKTLDSITVNVYTAPSVSFTVERTTATGTPEDEGTYATIDATYNFTDVIADAVAPTVIVTDEDGVQTTPTVTWYSSRATDGTLSGSVTWANLSSGDTVYGLIPNLNTEFSWQIAITPRDTEGTGTAITQTLAGAFYTIDFLAGGHGIAFGKPATDNGFECAMNASFIDANGTMRALFDFIYPVGSYYETSDTSFDPNTTWGGTWSLEAEGLVHIGAGSNYTVGDTGGEATHTLTENEMPSHLHGIRGEYGAQASGAYPPGSQYYQLTGNLLYGFQTVSSESKGGGQPHNIMQPYIVVNRWHRTA